MSKVQCLRSLETRDLEPRDLTYHRSPLPVKRSVCRNLFGFVDHDALQRDMTQTLRDICARDRDRWNFNFELSSPQDGVYEWRRVSSHDLPEFYRDSVRSGRTRVPAGPRSPVSLSPVSQSPVSLSPVSQSPVSQSPVSLSPVSQSPVSQSPVSLSPVSLSPVSLSPVSLSPVSQSPVSQSPVSQTPVSRRRTHALRTAGENTRVTDFFVKRKKVVDRTDVKSAIRSERTEQTPRKKLR